MDLSMELEMKIRNVCNFQGQIDIHYFCEKTHLSEIDIKEKKVLLWKLSHVVVG